MATDPLQTTDDDWTTGPVITPLGILPTPSPFDTWRFKVTPGGSVIREPLYREELDKLVAEIADLKARIAKLEAESHG